MSVAKIVKSLTKMTEKLEKEQKKLNKKIELREDIVTFIEDDIEAKKQEIKEAQKWIDFLPEGSL